MQLELKKYLFDILEAIKDIENFTKGLSYSDFNENGMAQAAAERKFEIIGEALNRIKYFESSVLNNISEHHRIIGFRNILAHGYDDVDNEIVWNAIKNHLPKLKKEIKNIFPPDAG